MTYRTISTSPDGRTLTMCTFPGDRPAWVPPVQEVEWEFPGLDPDAPMRSLEQLLPWGVWPEPGKTWTMWIEDAERPGPSPTPTP